MQRNLPIYKKLRTARGFTLIELLVVIGVLTTLLAIVLIAVNPARQFSLANNTQRRSDVLAILDAIQQYASDYKGALPAGITSTPKTITSTSGATNIDLCGLLTPTYIAQLPFDPLTTGAHFTACNDYNTGYTVASGTGNRLTVSAPGTEIPPATATISATR